MPFDGNGNYSPPAPPTFPAVNGEVIRSDYFNSIITDIATALSNTLTKDGQSLPTAAIDFNGQDIEDVDALEAISVDALNYFVNGDPLTEVVLDDVASSLVSGPGIAISYDDVNDQIQISATSTSDSIGGLISGGQVIWEQDYDFRVSAATYTINGTQYASTEQTVTLTAADATLDRIDVIYLDNTGTAGVITGTAAALPTEPDIAAGTQLKLTFVFVPALSTAPTGITNTNIYLENTEWTSSTSGSGFNPASTNNPYSGTTCIEGTTVANNAYVSLQAGAPITLDDEAMLYMFVRSKASWASGRVLRVQWYSSGVAKGTPITIASGYWGFNSALLGSYQLIAIPIPQFVVPFGTSINQLRITDSGGSIGFYIDNIVLQSKSNDVGENGTSYLTKAQADALYQPLGGAGFVPTGPITTSGLTQATNKLLGRGTASTGAVEEITLGTNLSLSGTTLNTTGLATTSQTEEMIAGFIASPSDKSYTIALKMAHAGTITETTTKSASGTCTATFKINSTALGGTANSVSSSEQSQSHSSTNTFVAGDDIVLTISSNSSCTDMSFTIKYTRALA